MEKWIEGEDAIICPYCETEWGIDDSSQHEDYEADAIYTNCPSCGERFQVKCVNVVLIIATRKVSDVEIEEHDLTYYAKWKGNK